MDNSVCNLSAFGNVPGTVQHTLRGKVSRGFLTYALAMNLCKSSAEIDHRSPVL